MSTGKTGDGHLVEVEQPPPGDFDVDEKDFYAVLGVARNATQAQIKKAYQARAKLAHPDREGGSHEKMALLNQVYRVLGDPDLRKHYDEFGIPPDLKSILEEAYGVLTQCFSKALDVEESDDVPYLVFQMVQNASKSIENNIANLQRTTQRLERKRTKVRFKSREGKRNMFLMVLDERVTKTKCELEGAKRMQEVNKTVRRLLTDFEYIPPPPPPSMGPTPTTNEELMRQIFSRW